MFLKEFLDPEMTEYYYCDDCLIILNFEDNSIYVGRINIGEHSGDICSINEQ